ncbi:MocR-like pyridoxine biosynthesis transcription factor PdxR [Paraburkholderia sp. ZP32-5]|uniref:MocR-like pyridoxine biosynthesis transcription factor PdxR n=1 Tax=Paraburkholderia sp. ZP32-5 TaxID=2883245 RepID=UPI001F38F2DB|nr:PLP-dependent aminotransferase family protein [Paraburkholderia sp. ZP32-5]
MRDLLIRLDGTGPIQQQVYGGIYAALEDGRLALGQRLPASRTWALQLGVSRNTIREATAALIAEGWLETRVGAGLFVRAIPAPVSSPANSAAAPLRLSEWSERLPVSTFVLARKDVDVDFRPGVVSNDAEQLFRRKRLARWPSDLEPAALSEYGPPEGDIRLRERIAAYLRQSRAVRCTAADIVITTGTHQSLDLLSRLLLGAGTTFAIEDPGFPVVAEIMRLSGSELASLQVDDQGINVDDIPPGIAGLYCTPNHQFPLGVTLSPQRRKALIARAAKEGFVIIEDDYDCEFYYGTMPSPCLQSEDENQRVIYLGSLSKTLAPGFRLGFIVAPPWLLDRLKCAKWIVDRQTSTHVQNSLLQFIVSGDFASHLSSMRLEYEKRHTALLEAIRERLHTWLTPLSSTCGLHISTRVNDGFDTNALCRIADEEGVGIYRGDTFSCHGRASDILVFGFGGTSTQQIMKGVGLLAAAWQGEDQAVRLT